MSVQQQDRADMEDVGDFERELKKEERLGRA
jgi:hypothetical protein